MMRPNQPQGQEPSKGLNQVLPASQILDSITQFEALFRLAVGCFGDLSPAHMRDTHALIEGARKCLAIVDAEHSVAFAPEILSLNHRKVAWLAGESHIPHAEAHQRVNCLGWLRKEAEPFSSENGDERMPTLWDKVSGRVVGADAAQEIDKTVRDLLKSEHARVAQALDEHTSEVVTQVRVDDLGVLSHRLRAMLGLDDPYTDEDRQWLWGVKVGP